MNWRTHMTKRENIIRILKRQDGEHIPFELSFTPKLQKEFEQRTGTDNVAEYYDFDFRRVGLNPSRIKLDFSRYYEGKSLKKGYYLDNLGVAHEPGSVEHFTHRVSPLVGSDTTTKDIEEYPMSDREADYRYEGKDKHVSDIHKKGYAVCAWVGHTFESAWQIRGMEDMLMNFYDNPKLAHTLLERIAEKNIVASRKFTEAKVDIVMLGDDVGTQTGMMMSPDIWREFLKPRLERQIKAAKDVNPDVLTWYHSDGNIEVIIPDLIEIGLDILNPVQPECMDPVMIKNKYGDELSFWGAIGTQSTMPFGTPQDVKDVVKNMIEKVGHDGGLVLAPTHVLEPEVPWENIDAFVEACKEYGVLN